MRIILTHWREIKKTLVATAKRAVRKKEANEVGKGIRAYIL